MIPYNQLKNRHPVMEECFFAFSDSQVAEGIKKMGLEGKELFNGGFGLIGTREGIKKFMEFYDNNSKEIAANCDPQEMYECEFYNHECEYNHDDTEAIKLVVATFGEERAKTVKRHNGCAYAEIDDLFKAPA